VFVCAQGYDGRQGGGFCIVPRSDVDMLWGSDDVVCWGWVRVRVLLYLCGGVGCTFMCLWECVDCDSWESGVVGRVGVALPVFVLFKAGMLLCL
jgi:hypothetical protein